MQINNERGVTLVELLAGIVISAIIGIIGYSLLMSGFSTYERVKAETKLRDEADLIMVSLINELYSLKNSEIDPNHNVDANNYILLKNGMKIGFVSNHLEIKGRSINISDGIRITENTTIENAKNENGGKIVGQYFITLELEILDGNHKLATESEIGIIVDDTEWGGEDEET